LIRLLYGRKGLEFGETAGFDFAEYKQKQYDHLADTLRLHLDMERIYRILEEGIC
jgi:adenosylcobyric acid synthase